MTIATEMARAQVSAPVIRIGAALVGTVLSPLSRPEREVDVIGAGHPWDGSTIRLTTDKEGRFRSGRFHDTRWPRVAMTVRATGLARYFPAIVPSPEMWPRSSGWLAAGRLMDHVVDARGRPLAAAAVS